MGRFLGAALAVILPFAAASGADAAVVTKTITFNATGLVEQMNGTPAPISAMSGSFTVTYDNTVPTDYLIHNNYGGVTVNALNFTPSAYLTAGWDLSSDGTLYIGFGETPSNDIRSASAYSMHNMMSVMPNDFALQINPNVASGTNGSLRYASGGNVYYKLFGVSYTVSDAPAAVPEPATWAMALLGFGAVGAGMRRRRKGAAAIA